MSKKDNTEFRIFIEELKRQPENVKENTVDFYADAMLFSTWYLAVADQAKLSPIDYLKQGLITAARVELDIPLPDQTLFQMTVEMADAFLEGRVNPDELAKLSKFALIQTASLVDTGRSILLGAGFYEIDKDMMGFPKAITDSFYPDQLVTKMKSYINEDGLVVSVAPLKRKMIKALIADEMSGLIRIGEEPHP